MNRLVFTGHALRQMFARSISQETVVAVVAEGRVVAEYPEDRPYPSRLLLGWEGARPIHVVASYNEVDDVIYIITAYEPDPGLWEPNYTKRRSP